ncbi:MAG: sulfatase [Planctomycetota bacterium]
MANDPSDSQPPRPNIIWFFGDQHRAQAQSWMGDPNLSTPHIDRMACEGVAFDRAVAPCPWCTPFRGSLLTSMYTHQCVQRTPQRMDPGLPTVAHAFGTAGYDTAYFGKWHLDGGGGGQSRMQIIPPERRGGFRRWWGFENINSPWDVWVHGERDDGSPFQERMDGYETDALTDRLIAYCRDRAADREPFFAVASTTRPHDPYVAPAEWMQRHRPGQVELRPNVPPIDRIRNRARRDLAGYYASIENLDWNLGRLRSALEESGLADNTWIVFFADHGDMHGSHGYWRKSCPWEEAIRIPCIFGLHRPWHREGGRRSGTWGSLFTAMDFAPTSLGLCDIPVPEGMRGVDYSGAMRDGRPDPAAPDAVLLQQCVAKSFECQEGTWRGIVTDDGWKYVCDSRGPILLVDLDEDPYELYDRSRQVGGDLGRRKDLHHRLQELLDAAGDDFQLPTLS